MKTHKALTMAEFRETLKKHDLKVTPQRVAVHEAMLKLGHACADMVTEHIQREGKTKVTVASVYNILTQMAMNEIYHHRMSSNNKMYFDVNTFKHMHLYNTEDNTYLDAIDEELYTLIEEKLSHRRFRGYHVDGVDIQILVHPSSRRKKRQ
jgi:Fe2+/Zn2+ uptake regulation proteins